MTDALALLRVSVALPRTPRRPSRRSTTMQPPNSAHRSRSPSTPWRTGCREKFVTYFEVPQCKWAGVAWRQVLSLDFSAWASASWTEPLTPESQICSPMSFPVDAASSSFCITFIQKTFGKSSLVRLVWAIPLPSVGETSPPRPAIW